MQLTGPGYAAGQAGLRGGPGRATRRAGPGCAAGRARLRIGPGSATHWAGPGYLVAQQLEEPVGMRDGVDQRIEERACQRGSAAV